jgi:hypothetical protein
MTARRILVALLLATMLASCTGGDGDNPDSGDDQAEGSSTVGPITLTVPKGWTEDPKAEERNEDAAWVAPLGDGDTVAPQGVNVVVSKAAGDIEQAYQLHAAGVEATVTGIERGEAEEVDVDGADGAKRVVWTIPASEDRPEATLYDLLAIAEDGTQVLVRVSTREPPTDAELADAVLGSVAFTS